MTKTKSYIFIPDLNMGCLCPRKVNHEPPIAKEKERCLGPQAATQQDFMVQSERNKILPDSTTRKSNRQKIEMLSRMPTSPSEKTQYNKQELTQTKYTSAKGCHESIIVSQLGGSKMERTISIISTEADIVELNQTVHSTRSSSQDMIVVANNFSAKQKLKKIQKRYYSLIKNKLYVKKNTSNIIKIKTLSSQFSLFCNMQTLRQTIHAIDGIPIQNIKILTKQPLSYIIQDVYPLVFTIKFQCKKCGFKKLKTSSSCKVQIDNLQCRCGSKEFKTTEIQTSPEPLPVWFEGKKIVSCKMDLTVGEFRIIGCNICWKFETCTVMKCGCLRCSICSYEHPNDRCILCL